MTTAKQTSMNVGAFPASIMMSVWMDVMVIRVSAKLVLMAPTARLTLMSVHPHPARIMQLVSIFLVYSRVNACLDLKACFAR